MLTQNIRTLNYLPCTFNKIYKSMLLPVNVYKIVGCVANSVDLDQTPRSVFSDLGIHCLFRPVCPNSSGKVR